jgi:hypothetical protein
MAGQRIIVGLLSILCVMGMLTHGASAQGVQSVDPQKPLMVIRFSQDHVHYKNSLSFAVAKAKSVNPNVAFDVMSYVPSGKTRSQTERIHSKAQEKVNEVINEIRRQGVERSQIDAAARTVPALEHQEIFIYVR